MTILLCGFPAAASCPMYPACEYHALRELVREADCRGAERCCTADGDVSKYCLFHEAQRWHNAHDEQVKRKRTGAARMKAHYEKKLRALSGMAEEAKP